MNRSPAQKESQPKLAKANTSFFSPVIQKKLSVGSANDSYEVEADNMADRVMRMPEPKLQNVTHTGSLIQRKCAACEEEEKIQLKPLADSITPLIQRRSTESSGESHAPSQVESQINSSRGSGSSMDQSTQSFMENRFGTDFSDVKIHTGSQAVQMSRELNAHAFTVGNDIYFNDGKYSPNSDSGKHLLAHELTHTVQQGGNVKMKIQRTPARQVGCRGPFTVPITGTIIADPVSHITEAETHANQLLDIAINDLQSTRDSIIAGAGVGWPTISDSLAFAIRLLGNNPDSDNFWRRNGINTASLLLRRLRSIRRVIGGGSIFYHCATQRQITIGSCSSRGCVGAEAESCPGSFHIILCQDWWGQNLESRASGLIHEHAHNFAEFVGDAGREGNAECYARFVQHVNDVGLADQRPDLCPDPVI